MGLTAPPRRGIDMLVYCVTNIVNGMRYVGCTTRAMSHRKWGHKKSYMDGAGSQNTIYQAYRDFGWENFKWERLEKLSTVEELRERERHWIAELNTLWPMGYNQNRGGSVTPANEYCKEYVCDGKSYFGYGQLADAYGVSEITVRVRIAKQGWTVRQAVGLDPKPKSPRDYAEQSRPVVFQGITYPSERDMCRKFGVCNNVFRQRYHRNGWALEEALEVCERKQSRHEVRPFGKRFKSISEAARFYGLNPASVKSRLHYGWSLEDALSKDLLPNSRPKPFKEYCIDGKVYRTYAEIGLEFGLSGEAVRSRIFRGRKAGKSLEQIFGGINVANNLQAQGKATPKAR